MTGCKAAGTILFTIIVVIEFLGDEEIPKQWNIKQCIL